MATKKKSSIGVIVSYNGSTEAKVLDEPKEGTPVICELQNGRQVIVLSKPNKSFVEVKVTKTVSGFVMKDFIKVK